MTQTRALSLQEDRSLQRLIRSRETIIHRRARIILCSAEGRSPTKIAEDLGLHPKTVRQVIRDFNGDGLSSIFPRKKTGRPKKFGTYVQDRLIELLRRKPEEFGIESGAWTLETACEVAVQKSIISSIGKESLRRILKDNNLSWKRVKGWIKPQDPAYQQKKAKRDGVVQRSGTHPDWDVEYTDESWLVAQSPDGLINPQMGSCWSAVGNPETVPTSNKKSKATVPMYAGISIKDQQMCYRFTGKVNSHETIGYLSWRAEEGKRRGIRRLFIIWDNASWHVSKMVRGWLRVHNKEARENGGTIISTILLPKRSPWLNPIESLFRWLKSKAIFCRIHENLEILKEMVMRVIGQRNDKTAGRC